MPTTAVRPLSPRQLEVLRLAAQGYSNAEIGRRLYLTINTVKNHAQDVMAKLGGRDRPHTVAIGIALGLVRPGDVLVTRTAPQPTRYQQHLVRRGGS
jgi:DNA-binding CsgD family transcriptional regulator